MMKPRFTLLLLLAICWGGYADSPSDATAVMQMRFKANGSANEDIFHRAKGRRVGESQDAGEDPVGENLLLKKFYTRCNAVGHGANCGASYGDSCGDSSTTQGKLTNGDHDTTYMRKARVMVGSGKIGQWTVDMGSAQSISTARAWFHMYYANRWMQTAPNGLEIYLSDGGSEDASEVLPVGAVKIGDGACCQYYGDAAATCVENGLEIPVQHKGGWCTIECDSGVRGQFITFRTKSAAGKQFGNHEMYCGELEAYPPPPSPYPTPQPTPQPTPPTPYPTPEPTASTTSAPGSHLVAGNLEFTVEDVLAFTTNPKVKLGLRTGIAKIADVNPSAVHVQFDVLRSRSLKDLASAGSRNNWSSRTQKELAAAAGTVMVSYEIVLLPSDDPGAVVNALAPSKKSEILTNVIDAIQQSTQNAEFSLDVAAIDTYVVTDPPTPAPTPPPTPPSALDGKSADGENDGEKKKGNKKKKKKQVLSCFPGDATVQVSARGDVRMSEVVAGDRVLTKSGSFEPVLGSMHTLRSQPAGFLTIVHSRGTFQASGNHLIFANEATNSMPMGKAQVGDYLFVGDGRTMVLSVRRSTACDGMFAPLTLSGSVVVDGVSASNYAAGSESMFALHVTAHAIAFPARKGARALQSLFGVFQADMLEMMHTYLKVGFAPLSRLQSAILA